MWLDSKSTVRVGIGGVLYAKSFSGFSRQLETNKNLSGDKTLLDEVLPEYEFRGCVSLHIRAAPEHIFQALNEVTLQDMPLARFLGEIRYLPSRILGKLHAETPASQPFLERVKETGNIELALNPNQEAVIGFIGKFHQFADQTPVYLESAEAFSAFDDPAYQKLAISCRITGGDEVRGYRLTFEHRTHALSDAARRKFARY